MTDRKRALTGRIPYSQHAWNSRLNSLRLHLEAFQEEGISIGPLVDELGGGGSAAVSGRELHTEKDRRVARLGGLKSSGELERVSGHDASIVTRVCSES